MMRKLFEAVGIEPQELDMSNWNEWIYPEVTAEHRERLIKLILRRDTVEFNFVDCVYCLSTNYSFDASEQIIGEGDTITQALESLLLQLIEKNILHKEEIRRVFE